MKNVLNCRSPKMILALATLAAGLAMTTPARAADPGKIVVQIDKPGAKINPNFYGLMTEEINYSYDGGLYGELIQNRIFKNPTPAAGRGGRGGRGAPAAPPAADVAAAAPTPPVAPHWSVVTSGGAMGTIALDTTDPVNTTALTTSLRLTIPSTAAGQRVGVANDGFWGIPVKPNSTYQASFYAKAFDGFTGPLEVDIESDDGTTIHTTATIPAITDKWQKYTVALKTGMVQPSATNRFVISTSSKGAINLNLVSLFPPTYKDRVNGDRVDLSELLADMKPAFLRFPGGNYVEGQTFADRWNWKATIGPLEQRAGHNSPWNYRSSDGMGMLEFLGWCEDLHMEPVLAVYAGYNLNRTSVPAEDYPIYAQDAVDAIEYITGDASTKWGAQRIKDGHPAAFKLTYVEVGNEDNLGNGLQTYPARFTVFYDAIKAKYPNIKVISTSKTGFGERTPDAIDEHYYMNFNSALVNAHMYDVDKRPRTGQKIFVGEWATRDMLPTPSFHCALTDAAFLTGLERNADIIIMSCYAPLLVNLNPGGQQWATDLIGYNAASSFGSPSYYVQKMFNNNRGDVVLPVELAPQLAPAVAAPPAAPAAGGGRGRGGATGPVPTLYASSSRDDATGDVIVKVVNAVETPQQMELDLQGAPTIGKTATLEILTGNLTDVNTLADPKKVVPKSSTIEASPKFVHEFPGNSVTVLRFKTK